MDIDYNSELKETNVKLPDELEVDISSFINSIPENIFNPKDLDDCVGLVDMIESAVKLEDESKNMHYKTRVHQTLYLSIGVWIWLYFSQK